jgi:tetratricopeptide (TPR) repeat protein
VDGSYLPPTRDFSPRERYEFGIGSSNIEEARASKTGLALWLIQQGNIDGARKILARGDGAGNLSTVGRESGDFGPKSPAALLKLLDDRTSVVRAALARREAYHSRNAVSAEEALASTIESGDSDAAAKAMNDLGYLLTGRGQHREALDLFERAVATRHPKEARRGERMIESMRSFGFID